MASVVTESNGRRLIQLSPSEHPSRPKIRLGKVNKRDAETARVHVENLIRGRVTGATCPPATAEWLAGVPASVRRRLERFGLIARQERRECPTLAEWLQGYVDGRPDVKQATTTVYGHTRRNLLAFFGKAKWIDEITCGDADAFRVFLKTEEGLAENTVRRRLGIAKQFFRAAVRGKIVDENPFDGQSTFVRENPKRFYFVSREETQAVLDACPDAPWRLVFALCRYGGLRCPSEVTGLKWEDINWEKMRFTVRAAKTEHHADGGIRVAPIFPELYPYFRDAFEAAEPGTVYCCPQYANPSQMYRKIMLKIIGRAGLTPWPKIFVNCRSTRETELAEEYPMHVICAWIGNSPKVAARHYLQVTDDHFAQAVQKAVHDPVQQASAQDRTESRGERAASETANVCRPAQNNAAPCENRKPHLVGRTGLEPVTSAL